MKARFLIVSTLVAAGSIPAGQSLDPGPAKVSWAIHAHVTGDLDAEGMQVSVDEKGTATALWAGKESRCQLPTAQIELIHAAVVRSSPEQWRATSPIGRPPTTGVIEYKMSLQFDRATAAGRPETYGTTWAGNSQNVPNEIEALFTLVIRAMIPCAGIPPGPR
jgi:hypothetical protein